MVPFCFLSDVLGDDDAGETFDVADALGDLEAGDGCDALLFAADDSFAFLFPAFFSDDIVAVVDVGRNLSPVAFLDRWEVSSKSLRMRNIRRCQVKYVVYKTFVFT